MFAQLSFSEPNPSLQGLNFDLAVVLLLIASTAIEYDMGKAP